MFEALYAGTKAVNAWFGYFPPMLRKTLPFETGERW
jgi:hypothetical protein